jgi:hypothetical protein
MQRREFLGQTRTTEGRGGVGRLSPMRRQLSASHALALADEVIE